MRLVIVFVAIGSLALGACSGSNNDDGPHRGQSGPYIGAGGGFAQ
jgi:hypothetical protein